MKAGTATITATTNNGKQATCKVTVTKSVTGVALNKKTMEIEKGKEETLSATVSPNDASDKTVTWNTDNSGVATVTNGKVKGIKAEN